MLFPYPHSIELRQGLRSPRVRRETDPALARPDEYEIVMDERETILRAGTDAGFFYGEKTLAELPADRIGRVRDWADVPLRIQMIDLKRIDWNFDYLLSLFPLFADLRINACLLEYEDKFPYRFSDRIPVPGAFTREQIRELAAAAAASRVEIIPLVQCFSHWEYILRHDEHADLREEPDKVSQACPLKPGTLALFRSMLEEVLELHPGCRFVHIGGDEARLLGRCPACAEKAERLGVERLWGDYLEAAIDEVNARGRTPLFWADFLWRHDRPLIRRNCVAVDWEYVPRRARGSETVVGASRYAYGGEAPERYRAALKPDPESRTVFAFPHLLWLRSAGYRAFGAAVVSSPDNVLAHASAARSEGLPAVLATYWAANDSLSAPRSLFPWCLDGVAMLGAAAWNAGHEERNRASFAARAAERLYGPGTPEAAVVQLEIAPMHFSAPPVPFGGPRRTWSRKLEFDHRMQGFLRDRTLFPAASYETLDLAGAANSNLDFTVDGVPCGFTVGRLRFMPAGGAVFGGFPFVLTDRLAVYGVFPGMRLPRAVVLPVRERRHPAVLSVVQSAVGGDCGGGRCGELVFRYRDGEASVPLVSGRNLGSWWSIKETGETRIAFSNLDDPERTELLGLHCWNCFNPCPERELLEVEFRMAGDGVVALAAATVLERSAAPVPEIAARVRETRGELERLAADLRQDLLRYTGPASADEICRLALDPHRCALDQWERILRSS